MGCVSCPIHLHVGPRVRRGQARLRQTRVANLPRACRAGLPDRERLAQTPHWIVRVA